MNRYRDYVADYFRLHPHEWINAEVLMTIGGRMAWRSRVSDARLELGMVIKNRQRKVGRRTVSEYRYQPPQGQMGLGL